MEGKKDPLGISSFFKKRNDSKPKFKKKENNNPFIFGFLITIFLSSFYYYGIGRQRYFVRSDVVVRKAGSDASADVSLTSLLGGGNQGSIEDARYLRTYLESPQVLEDLKKEFDFQKEYAKKFPDFYPGVSKNDSKEKIYETFRKQISIILNETTGIIRINTIGFSPNTAYKLNNFLINKAETFTNKLSQDVYKEQFEFAQNEARKNHEKLKKASFKLQKFQQLNKTLDFESYSIANSSFINILEGELVNLKVKYSALKREFIDQNAPEIISIKGQIEDVERQINDEKDSLVSENGKNLDKKIAKLSELNAELKFANDLYQASLAAAETTRLESLKTARFIAIISNPTIPESQWQYWRHKGFLTTISILFVAFSIIKFFFGLSDSERN